MSHTLPRSLTPSAPVTQLVAAPTTPQTSKPAPAVLAELLASAPRQHALRLKSPTPPQNQPVAAQARHAHD